MTEAVVVKDVASVMEQVIIKGDLASLSSAERVMYYNAVCDSVGLNPLTKPFDYITLNQKLTLYATKTCTDQLRRLHGVSITITSRESINGVYVVTARATLPDGRTDESTGAIALGQMAGEPLANTYMKAETKSKRRVTLSIVGLGMLDETEVETIPDAKPFKEDRTKQELKKAPPERTKAAESVYSDIVDLLSKDEQAGQKLVARMKKQGRIIGEIEDEDTLIKVRDWIVEQLSLEGIRC